MWHRLLNIYMSYVIILYNYIHIYYLLLGIENALQTFKLQYPHFTNKKMRNKVFFKSKSFSDASQINDHF